MSRLVALMLALGMVTAAGGAAATVYVPGHVRDGVYTRPHFLDAPEVRYDRRRKLDGEQASPPKPTIIDDGLPPAKLPAQTPAGRPELIGRSGRPQPVRGQPARDPAGSWAPRG